MKFDLQLDNNEDLEYFKTLFFRNVGIEQMVYDFYTNGAMVRVQVNGLEGAQLIRIGIFDYYKQDKTTSLNQILPLTDTRYSSFEALWNYWHWKPTEAWAEFSHGANEVELAFEKIREILHIVYKVGKLKAFL